MRQINALMTLCFIAVFVLVIASCSKTGDTGPAGATGPAGPVGTTGAAGPKGDTGVANVIYSAWLDVTYTQDATSMTWSAVIPAPKLDANMLSKGEMRVYINFGLANAPIVAPLPDFDGVDILNVGFELQKIDLISTYNYSTGTDVPSGQKYYQYRYILIPGGKAARSAINWNNYAEVKRYLNLKD
ncbi:MAG TPA: hypothetical protein VK645_13130 [Chitinophagaceae bacterium]|nr:hypothetical protein [Chitinophagaceae bacterium]